MVFKFTFNSISLITEIN